MQIYPNRRCLLWILVKARSSVDVDAGSTNQTSRPFQEGRRGRSCGILFLVCWFILLSQNDSPDRALRVVFLPQLMIVNISIGDYDPFGLG